MSTLSVRLPDSLHHHLKTAARADGISINQFISLAVAEKLAALQTYEIMAKKAEGASREKFLSALARVGKHPVPEEDRVD